MTQNSPARPGRLTRWRLAEPVRFYLWPVFAGLIVLFARWASAGEWLAAAEFGVAGVLLFAAGEAARASVYSEPSHVAECLTTAQRVARGELIP